MSCGTCKGVKVYSEVEQTIVKSSKIDDVVKLVLNVKITKNEIRGEAEKTIKNNR